MKKKLLKFLIDWVLIPAAKAAGKKVVDAVAKPTRAEDPGPDRKA